MKTYRRHYWYVTYLDLFSRKCCYEVIIGSNLSHTSVKWHLIIWVNYYKPNTLDTLILSENVFHTTVSTHVCLIWVKKFFPIYYFKLLFNYWNSGFEFSGGPYFPYNYNVSSIQVGFWHVTHSYHEKWPETSESYFINLRFSTLG